MPNNIVLFTNKTNKVSNPFLNKSASSKFNKYYSVQSVDPKVYSSASPFLSLCKNFIIKNQLRFDSSGNIYISKQGAVKT